MVISRYGEANFPAGGPGGPGGAPLDEALELPDDGVIRSIDVKRAEGDF